MIEDSRRLDGKWIDIGESAMKDNESVHKKGSVQARNIYYFMWPYIILAAIDFLLTSNPFEANHGYTSYFVGVGRIFLAIFVIVNLYNLAKKRWRIHIPKSMILFVFTMIAVSFLNGDFFYYPQKVAADLFRIFFTALLAWQEVQRKNTDVKENEVKIWKYLVILMIIGVLLVFVGGDNYGRFPVSLHPNRAYRGEVTFWNTINHMDILLALSFVLYEYKKKIYFLFPAIFNAGFMYLAWHRTEFIVSITPFVLYAIFRDRNQTRRIILLSCCIPFIPIVFLVYSKLSYEQLRNMV